MTSAATSAATDHFERRLAFETDAADVWTAVKSGSPGFTLIDARSPSAYAKAHLPGAVSLPHAQIDEGSLAALPDGALVTYCWGPGCNAATKAAAKLSALGRPVKEMIGGFEYWVREGSPVEGRGKAPGAYAPDASGLVG
jgi:rhodanese-related sulfurtransferase